MSKLKTIFTDKRIAFLIRLWSVGAVYFFIGWGTNIGQKSAVDFVFFLGVSIAVLQMFIVKPVVQMMLNVNGRPKYGELSLKQKVLYRLGEITKSIVIVALLLVIYNAINLFAIQLFDLDSSKVVFPGEPISFALLYMAVCSLIEGIFNRIHEEKVRYKIQT